MEYYRLTVPIPKQPLRWLGRNLALIILLGAIIALSVSWLLDHMQLAGELRLLRNPGPDYDAMQATGPPDAGKPGDSKYAWCPRVADGGEEWLLLEYDQPLRPSMITIHENFAQGAVKRITYLTPKGKEMTLWEGTYKPAAGSYGGVAQMPVTTNQSFNQIKVYIDTGASPGWNEIDAVGLMQGGEVLWASRATASSTWNQTNGSMQPAIVDSRPTTDPFQ